MLYTLYGNVPSLIWQTSAFRSLSLTLFFFLFALLISVCESGKDIFHMPRSPERVISQLSCSHWLVDAIIQFEYLWNRHYAWKGKKLSSLYWKGVFQISRHVSGLHIVLKMWVKCDVISPHHHQPPPTNHHHPFMTPLLGLLMWLLLICILI